VHVRVCARVHVRVCAHDASARGIRIYKKGGFG